MVVPELGQQQIGIGPLITQRPLLHLCNQSTFQPFQSLLQNFKEAFLASGTRNVGNTNWLLMCHPGQVKTSPYTLSMSVKHPQTYPPIPITTLRSHSTTSTRSLLNHDPLQTHQSLFKPNGIGPFTPHCFPCGNFCLLLSHYLCLTQWQIGNKAFDILRQTDDATCAPNGPLQCVIKTWEMNRC